MARLVIALLGAAALWVASAHGTSTPQIPLTPKNVGDHPRLSVSAESHDDGVWFTVVVRGKDAKTLPEVAGAYLTVKDGERLVCSCLVQPEPIDNRVLFRFVIAEGYSEKSQFSFTVATTDPEQRKKLPAGAGFATYQFTPKDFLAAKAKEEPNEKPKPNGAKPTAKLEERYVAYWLTSDPRDPKNTASEPLLFLVRFSMEQLADEKQFAYLLRILDEEKPRTEVLEAIGLTVETCDRDSLWNPGGRPFKAVASIKDIDPKAGRVVVNGNKYKFEECPLGEAVRLLEYPEGKDLVHRIDVPRGGPAQINTARALRALLREQHDAEMMQMTPQRVRAFVAYLERNGIKLVPGGERDAWWVAGLGERHGPFEVRIHGFSPVVTEKWMRLVLDKTSWAAELNGPARLAMSKAIAQYASDLKKSAGIKALEEKLLRLFRAYEPPADVVAADRRIAKEQDDLLAFLKDKGVELRPTENGSNYISQMFTVGPDHDKNFRVGLNYLPPLTLEEASRNYGPIPVVVQRGWALFMVGGPGGNATKEYKAVWEKVEAALKAYPGPTKEADK